MTGNLVEKRKAVSFSQGDTLGMTSKCSGLTRLVLVHRTIIIDLVVHCIYSLPCVMGVPPHHFSPKEPRKPRPPRRGFLPA